MRQGSGGEVQHDAAMVKDLLELGSRLLAFARLQVGQSPQVNRVKKGYSWRRRAQFIGRSQLQSLNGSPGIFLIQGNRSSNRGHPVVVDERV